MTVGPIPDREAIMERENGWLGNAWRAWFNQLQFFTKEIGKTGTTAQRPTERLYIGQEYFDVTLGFPVWIRDIGPPVVWVDAGGNPV